MGITLTGDKARYTGFVFEDPTVFFFIDGEEVGHWDCSSFGSACGDDGSEGYSLAVTMHLFHTRGEQIALDYINGEPHAGRPEHLPRL